jgi:hypothetical protein
MLTALRLLCLLSLSGTCCSGGRLESSSPLFERHQIGTGAHSLSHLRTLCPWHGSYAGTRLYCSLLFDFSLMITDLPSVDRLGSLLDCRRLTRGPHSFRPSRLHRHPSACG